MTDWLGGYSAGWEVQRVDPSTWGDAGALEGVRSVSIDRDCTGDVPLLETGEMALVGSLESAWYRIYMVAEQDSIERIAMATLLFERISARTQRGACEVKARGRSTLQPAADRRMPRGAYAPASCDGAAYVAGILRECTPAPVSVDGSFTLVDDVVFDVGCTYLEAAWTVLNAAGWCMQIDGLGRITVMAKPTDPALALDDANAGLLLPGVDDDFSIVDVPNRYYAVDDGEVAVAENTDEGSMLGYPQRGRWVDKVDTSPVLVDGESLEMYARRKLAEESTITRTFTYEREYWPNVFPFSVVHAMQAANGIEGDLRVMTQNIECGRGVKVTEKSGMEVMA